MHLWLAKDPETDRVTAQESEWSDRDFPKGARGRDWPKREIDVPDQTWTKMLRATWTPTQQDKLHRQWWSEAAPEGSDPWPA